MCIWDGYSRSSSPIALEKISYNCLQFLWQQWYVYTTDISQVLILGSELCICGINLFRLWQSVCWIGTWIAVYTIIICKTFGNKTKYIHTYTSVFQNIHKCVICAEYETWHKVLYCIYSNDFVAGTNYNLQDDGFKILDMPHNIHWYI
jgi:hypothetical protein